MRTFIAIPIPEDCLNMLERLQQNLRACRADVRYTPIKSIHLTLKFLGEVNPELLPELAKSVEKAAPRQAGFELRLRGIGCFPNQKNPRVIWCGIEGETERLSELFNSVETACASLGFAPEHRDFHPHLTLGRVKGKRNLQPLLDCIKIGSDLERKFRVDCINIYKSTLRPRGAEYTVLRTIMLVE
jgi:2'-5' RNA ligase